MNRLSPAIVLALALLLSSAAPADDWPQWRGPERTGLSEETGLLKTWPEGGPKLLWAIDTPGKGYAAPSVVGETIYLTGTEGRKGALYALDLSGKVKWRQVYGAEFTKSNAMSRTTPTVQDGSAYVYSGEGWAACFDAKTGKRIWAVDTFRTFRGRNIQWGIAESPLVVDGKFICHPGGPDAAVVALDGKTGKTVWTSKGLGEKSAYCSPIAVQIGSRQVILTQTEGHIVGLDAPSGKVLWKVPQRNRWAVHPNTPIFFDGMVFISSGYRYGSQLIKLSDDGSKASPIWQEKKLDNHHQGVLLIDGYVYGSSSGGRFYCLNPKDGSIVYRVSEVRKASIVYADQRIYAYDEKGGKVSLVQVSGEGHKLCGQFSIKKGSGPHWAHPVVANGVLYIRHGEAFLAFDVKAR